MPYCLIIILFYLIMKILLIKQVLNNFSKRLFIQTTTKHFTGKTETGFKFTTPKLKMRSITPVHPAPGYNLKLPDWTTQKFCEKIGGDCHDIADKFEGLQEMFDADSVYVYFNNNE